MEIDDNRVSSSSEDEEDPSPHKCTSSWLRDRGHEIIDTMTRGMDHAVLCPEENGCNVFCERVKGVIYHCENCMLRRLDGCEVCSLVVAGTVFHSRICQEPGCQIVFCEVIKSAMELYSPGSYHLIDLDHLTHLVIRRLQDLNPNRQTSEEEEGEADEASIKIKWYGIEEQVDEISSTT
uniref:histone acetyltransferase n=1 Tax=Caenorhabditis tropicalis TaxID=1561998 RepID=A0A1I7U8P9_9PELO